MSTRLAELRHAAFLKQSGRCYYCGFPMWEKNPDAFAKKNNVDIPRAMQLRCTAEHLRARVDGGRNARKNIVAACLYCNQHRHRSGDALNPTAYREKVRTRLTRGRWHLNQLLINVGILKRFWQLDRG